MIIKYIFELFIYTTVGISILILFTFENNISSGYENIILFPIVYLLVYIVVYRIILKSKYKFTAYGVIIMQWIRFVLMPPILAIAGSNAGFVYLNPDSSTLNLATLLMIYELLFSSVFILIWISILSKFIKIKKIDYSNVKLVGNKLIYVLFVVLGVLVYLLVGRKNELINFLIIPVSDNNIDRAGDVTGSLMVLAQQIILISAFVLFLLVINYCLKKYNVLKSNKYIYISILISLFCVVLIIGERRSAQLYISIVAIWILTNIYPKFKYKIITIIGMTGFMVILLMSIYKFFGAFLVGSYGEALGNANIDIAWISRTLQSYFFGPENIAVVLEFFQQSNLNLSNFFKDIVRSIFLVNVVVPDTYLTTSQQFNSHIYNGSQLSGHIISSVSFGMIFFGILLSPIVSIINIIFATIIENILYSVKSLEMMFLWSYILVRFIRNLYVNTPSLLNFSTIFLGTCGLLFIIAIVMRPKEKRSVS